MKKGFTLIELLAVIVILAIIALIATPIVLNIISNTKESASLRSADFYLAAVELSIVNATLNNKSITDGTYPIMPDGNVCLGTLTDNACDKDILKVEVKVEKPSGGMLAIEKGQIVNQLSTNEEGKTELIIDNKTIVKNANGELVYQDNTSSVCTYQDSEDDTGDAIGKIDLSDIVTCDTESFYVIKNDGTNINMLAKYGLNVGQNQYSNP